MRAEGFRSAHSCLDLNVSGERAVLRGSMYVAVLSPCHSTDNKPIMWNRRPLFRRYNKKPCHRPCISSDTTPHDVF